MLRNTIALLFCAALMGASTVARAQTINFAGLPDMTQVTNQFPAFTVSLIGGPDSAGPAMTQAGQGLCNTENSGCSYPTANILDFAFTSPTSQVGFIFNDYGDNGVTSYYAYNGSDVLVASGNISSVEGGAVNLSAPGITDLQINNNQGPSNNWVFVVSELNPNGTVTTPEPATYGLTVIGLALLGLMRKRLLSPLR